MTAREYFVKTIADEAPRFERVFKAMPADKLEYKPNPASRSAKEVANSMAGEAGTFSAFLKTGVIDFMAWPWPKFATIEEIATAFSKGLSDATSSAEGMAETDWDSECKMMSGEKVEWKTTKGEMAWGLLLDLIHHRGQLSAYLRPMGGKVPSIYGPSGDEKG